MTAPLHIGRRFGMISALDRKLFRDLWRMRGQALAIALVAAAGVAIYVMMLGNFTSLRETRLAYYERYNMADMFASAKRAPEDLVHDIAQLPGVRRVETRIAGAATIDLEQVVESVRAQLVSVDPAHQRH